MRHARTIVLSPTQRHNHLATDFRLLQIGWLVAKTAAVEQEDCETRSEDECEGVGSKPAGTEHQVAGKCIESDGV